MDRFRYATNTIGEDNMEQLLTEYAELRKERAEFCNKNAEILATLAAFDLTIAEKEDAIKQEARERKEDIEQDGVIVKVARKFKKWYDAKSLSPEDRRALLEHGGLDISVVSKVFEELVHNGVISQETRAKAFREEEGTPAISIRYNAE